MERPSCRRCRKPAPVCICARVPRVANRTPVILLQHPKERDHPFGTARFAELALERVEVAVHEGLGRRPSPLGPLPPGTGVIYPRPEAPLLGDAPESPRALLFLDGTWAQSRTLHRINPALHTLPHYRLQPSVPSRYQIRGEPGPHCVSTVEAIAEALSMMEPDLTGLDELIAAFEHMIAQQLDYRRAPRPRRKKPRPKPPSRAVPTAFTEATRVVLAYGELSRTPGGPWEIVYWAAIDLDGRRTFSRFVRPSHRPSQHFLESAGLTSKALERAVDPEVFRRDWKTFKGDALIASWNASTLRHTGETGVALKTAYCNLRSTKAGPLSDVLLREELDRAATPFCGRADLVLGALIPVARLLRHLGTLDSSIAPG